MANKDYECKIGQEKDSEIMLWKEYDGYKIKNRGS